jgi:adenylosuccinate synthase
LPKEAVNYLKRVEELTGIPVSWIGTGPEREAMVKKDGK